MTAPDVRTPDGNRASAEGNEPAHSNALCERTPELHAAHVDAHAAHRKRFETLRAHLSMMGFELRRLDDGIFIVSRWNITRECLGLDEVEKFARQAGVRP